MAPDGCTLDAEGGIWFSDAAGSRVVRVLEGGEISHEVPTPQPTFACALGGEDTPRPCPGGIDFLHPDFALMCAKTGLSEGCSSFFYASTDRCHSWQGPYSLPMFDQTGIAARTDYLIDDTNTCTLFLTANKTNGKEGRVFAARSTNGGESFDFLSFIGPEPPGFNIDRKSVV